MRAQVESHWRALDALAGNQSGANEAIIRALDVFEGKCRRRQSFPDGSEPLFITRAIHGCSLQTTKDEPSCFAYHMAITWLTRLSVSCLDSLLSSRTNPNPPPPLSRSVKQALGDPSRQNKSQQSTRQHQQNTRHPRTCSEGRGMRNGRRQWAFPGEMQTRAPATTRLAVRTSGPRRP